MLQRIISGVVALAIVIPVLVFGGVDGAKWLVAAAMLIMLNEFGSVASPERPRGASVVMAAVGMTIYGMISWGRDPMLVVGAMVIGAGALLTWSMFAHEDPEEGALAGSVTAVSVTYISAALAFIGLVRGFEPHGFTWLIFILVSTWVTDTGAYFAGRFFGKRKLLERISPKKTWAGVWGGVGLTVAVATGWALLDPFIPPHHAAILGALLAVSCVVGDLVESMFKRARGIKDSGNIMPGHGGLLDRVDSLLFTVPVGWAYATLFGL